MIGPDKVPSFGDLIYVFLLDSIFRR
ncbi:uncharacterized protein METZ01_LOCUS66679 [marine metagenome]|uniref:Uncharacterized protein n=1 Tax=marine metagenome TaxID=408172 RepID=A0A381TCD8_9ZZZZ